MDNVTKKSTMKEGGVKVYTSRGELNEDFLKLLYQGDILKKLEACKNRQEVCGLLKRFLKKVDPEEITESLVVIQSYLDEEQMEGLLTDEELEYVAGGMQNHLVVPREQITGFADNDSRARERIYTIYKNIQIY